MKVKDPCITIQNTDGADWLVSASGLVSVDGMETVSFATLVPRSDKSVPEVTRQAAQRAVRLLQMYLDQPTG